MAPTRKIKGVNRQISHSNVVYLEKDFVKSQQRKRKLSDKLGPRWDTEEIRHFYHAYRKYGKDWKKVAASVPNRFAEMVEALYNMNRAYLSLPEGTASVAGLVAMMIDHYNNEGSDSEGECGHALTTSQKSLKRKRGKVEPNMVKEITSQTLSIDSNDGCHSFLKRQRVDGVPPSALRKRTPRIPVSYLCKKNEIENNISTSSTGQKLDVNAHNKGAHVAALDLTKGLQRVGSPQNSQSPSKRKEQLKSPPIQSLRRMNMESKAARGDLHDAPKEEWLEGNVGIRRSENAEYVRDNASSLVAMEGVGTVQKVQMPYGMKKKVKDASSQFDNGGEACSGTNGGLVSALKKNVDAQVSIEKKEKFSPHGHKRRTKKLFFGDESFALDALQTLASVSLATNMDAESSIELKEESKRFDVDDNSSVAEASSACIERERGKISIKEQPENAFSGVEGSGTRKSKLGRNSIVHPNSLFEVKGSQQPSKRAAKRKRNSFASKIARSEPWPDLCLSNPSKSEAAMQEEANSTGKVKRSSEILALKRWRSGRIQEGYSNGDMSGGIDDSAGPTPQVPTAYHSSLPTKYISKRKLNLKRVLNGKELKCSEPVAKYHPNIYISSLRGSPPHLKEKISFCLSSPLLRQWCTFEWFYSAIDYPWFAKREFVEYLNHVGLGHIPRLTRVEWGVIRSSLGKPRRFSERFLYEEREKLKQYRESVRRHYIDLRTATKKGLPTDLARPMSVGQHVVALHPITREVLNGSILTVDQDKFRVQFDNHDLRVELVMDIDCMPSNPLENMPEPIRKQKSIMDKVAAIHEEQQVHGHLNYGGPVILASGSHMEVASSPLDSLLKPVKEDVRQNIFEHKEAAFDTCMKQTAFNQPCSVSLSQAKEADIKVISDLAHALCKKEALLGELRTTNVEISERQKNADGSLKESELFRKHYAMVLVQLKEASGQASSALVQMRERNTYPANSLLSCLKPAITSSGPNSLPNSVDEYFPSQEHGSTVAEIVKASRLKARTMVDAAIQAMSSKKEGDDVFKRIGEALNSIDDQQSIFDLKLPGIGSPEQDIASLYQGNHPNSCASESILDGCASLLQNDLNKSEPIPSELITSCVSTLLMIQACTERQCPPADVAQILDSAVTSLYPSCPQNLQIYREIQMSMGRLKTQILALVPT